jgi:hypothetical protein
MPIGLRRTNAGSAANLSTSTRSSLSLLAKPDAAVRGTREGTRSQRASVRGHRPRSAAIATVTDARVRRTRAPLLVVGVQVRRPEPGSRRGRRAARCAARGRGQQGSVGRERPHLGWGAPRPTPDSGGRSRPCRVPRPSRRFWSANGPVANCPPDACRGVHSVLHAEHTAGHRRGRPSPEGRSQRWSNSWPSAAGSWRASQGREI